MKKNIFLFLILILSIGSINAQKKVFADHWKFIGTAIEEPGYHIWGSSPIIDEDGKTHLFCARWSVKAKFNPGWRSHSEIAHYVGNSPEGPFIFKEVVLKGTGKNTWDKYGVHNPTIHKVGDKYILLYIANNNYQQPPHPANQCIGMMISENLSGPWKKVGQKGLILSPSENPEHWTYKATNGVNNPALLELRDGRFLLYFKSEGGKMGVAFSDNVVGPYEMYTTPVTRNDQAIEDGYAFMYNDKICLLTTDNHGIINEGGGLLWTSDDGISFDQCEAGFYESNKYISEKEYPHRKLYRGTKGKFERPQILMIDSVPEYLYTPCTVNYKGGKGTVSYILKFEE